MSCVLCVTRRVSGHGTPVFLFDSGQPWSRFGPTLLYHRVALVSAASAVACCCILRSIRAAYELTHVLVDSGNKLLEISVDLIFPQDCCKSSEDGTCICPTRGTRNHARRGHRGGHSTALDTDLCCPKVEIWRHPRHGTGKRLRPVFVD